MGCVTGVHVAAAVGRFAPRLVPRPWRALGADTLWQPDGMQMELRKGAYLSLNISPPSTPAVCHAPSTPSPFGPHQLMRLAGPVPPTSVESRLKGGHTLITSCTTLVFKLLRGHFPSREMLIFTKLCFYFFRTLIILL